MPRIVPAVIAGLILSQLVALIFWWWGFYLHPPSPVDDLNPLLARANPGRLPAAAMLWQALGQGLGAFLGGRWASSLAREGAVPAWTVGGLSFLLAAVAMVLYPRPLWFPVLSLLFVAGGAWAAGRLAGGLPRRAAA
jgi:hypothetical protein